MCDLLGLRSSDSRFSFAVVILDQTRRHHQNATTKTPPLQQPPNHAAILQQRPNHKPNPQASPRPPFLLFPQASPHPPFLLVPLSIAENIGVWTPDWRAGGNSLVRYKSRGIRGTKRREFLSSSRVHLPVRVAVGVPPEFISRFSVRRRCTLATELCGRGEVVFVLNEGSTRDTDQPGRAAREPVTTPEGGSESRSRVQRWATH